MYRTSLFVIFLAAGCGVLSCTGRKKHLITSKGIVYAEIGKPLPDPGKRLLKGHFVRDTLFEDNGYIWRAAVVRHGGGRVYIEEEFARSGITNRIRIETDDLWLKNGLKVGSTVADLKARAEIWHIGALPEYKLFDFFSEIFPGIHFLISDPGVPFEIPDENGIPLSAFSPDSRVRMIVVF